MIDNYTSTGSSFFGQIEKSKTIIFDKYEVVVRLDEEGKFIDIISIGFNKNFMEMRHKQKLISRKDAYSYYPDEEK